MNKITKPKKAQKTRFLPERFPKKTIFISLFALAGFAVVFAKAATPIDSNFITTVTNLGGISQPSNYAGRDGGASALVGGKVTWIFGDTLYAPNVPVTGDLFRSATAAIGGTTNPTQVTEPLDSRKAPNQLIPHTPEEQAYNIAHRSGSDRYALWPASIVTRTDGNSAWIFFNDLLISGGKWTTQGTGIASIGAGSTLANRQPGMLFGPGEESFRKALPVGSTLYLYSGTAKQGVCPLAKAPVDQANIKGAYQVWNGSAWVKDLTQGKGIIPCSNMGFSVMYNKALKSYVEALIPNYSKAVYFSYAPAPEGPWSTPIKGFELPGIKEGSPPYVPNFHPELSNDGDKTVYLSYSGSTTSISLIKITIQPPANNEPASKLATSAYGTAVSPPSKPTPVPKSTSTKNNNVPAPIANQTGDTNTATSGTDTAPTTSSQKAVPKQVKLSWWQRANLYIKRHWNALMEGLAE